MHLRARTARRAAALVAGIAGLTGVTAAPAHANVIPLASVALSINKHGFVLGYFDLSQGPDGGVWNPAGQLTYLPMTPGYTGDFVHTMNDHNEIAGSVGNSYATLRPALWDASGAITLLPGPAHGEAMGINDHGVAVGYAGDPGQPTFPVRWDKHGEITPLPLPPGTLSGSATAINNHGVILGHVKTASGTQPLLWYPDGRIVDLPIDPANIFVNESALNDQGTSVGYAELPDYQLEAIRWSRDGQATILSTSGTASGINDEGVAVGSINNPDGSLSPASWSPDGQATILPTLPTSTPYVGGDAINDAGYIVGSETVNGSDDAVEWTPNGQVINLTAISGGQ